MAREHRPEVVLLDIGLPGMDGYEVAARLRREECCKDAMGAIAPVPRISAEIARSSAREGLQSR